MMQEQIKILNSIYNILLDTPKKIDNLRMVYRFNREENWDGIDICATVDGKKETRLHSTSTIRNIMLLCENLNNIMRKHTGGDWQKFVLTIDEDREVQTEFSYEPQSLYDDWTIVVKWGGHSLPTFCYILNSFSGRLKTCHSVRIKYCRSKHFQSSGRSLPGLQWAGRKYPCQQIRGIEPT